MSWVDSSVVSSSASRAFASSSDSSDFFCSRRRRYFSSSRFPRFGTRAVLVGMPFSPFCDPGYRRRGRFRTRDDTRFPAVGRRERSAEQSEQSKLPAYPDYFFFALSQRNLRDTPSRFAARDRLPPARRSVSSM